MGFGPGGIGPPAGRSCSMLDFLPAGGESHASSHRARAAVLGSAVGQWSSVACSVPHTLTLSVLLLAELAVGQMG